MAQQPRHFYEFSGLRLYPDQACIVRIRDGAQSFIRQKEKEFLVALLKKPQATVTYEELRRAVWPEIKEIKSALPTMRETKRSIDKLLRDLTHQPRSLIKTTVREGYWLDAHVSEGVDGDERWEASPLSQGLDSSAFAETGAPPTIESLRPPELTETQLSAPEAHSTPEATAAQALMPPAALRTDKTSSHTLNVSRPAMNQLASLFGGHLWHVLFSCALYALLYVVALLLEVAYQFDRFGATAVRLAPLVFLWMFVASFVGLSVDATRTRQGRAKGLVIALLCFTGSTLALYVALCAFLPAFPITESSHQSHTAQVAYLKNIGYFLPLAIVFMFLPFHFVVSLQRELRAGQQRVVRDLLLGKRRSVAPEQTIYLKAWQLALILSGAAVFSLVFTFYLLDHLTPGLYANLFSHLVFWRLLLYFALGLECLLWYAQSLNALKRECLDLAGDGLLNQFTSSRPSLSERDAL